MKIFICASRHLYNQIAQAKKALEEKGFILTMPNNYDDPMREEEIKKLGQEEYSQWKKEMLILQKQKVEKNDVILVMNLEKNGQENYIGGATFLEMYQAFELGKKVYLYNPIPDNMLKDEIIGMNPVIINGDLELIK